MPVTFEQRPVLGQVGTLPGANAPEPERPDFLTETLPAAFQTENTIGSFIMGEDYPTRFDRAPVDDAYDPFKDIKGYEDHADLFAFANNDSDVAAIKRQLDRERENRDILARSGWTGVSASLIAGLVDPINLIPVGGTAYKSYRMGSSVLKGAATTARAGLLGSTAAEIALHSSQELRTWDESASNIAVATFLSGVLGGSMWAIRHGVEKRAMGKAFDDVARAPKGPIDDPLVELRPSEIERVMAERGPVFEKDGELLIKGRGFGLVKVVLNHGPMSDKPPELQVSRSDVTYLPTVLRKYEPADIEGAPGSNRYARAYRISRGGKTIVYGVSQFTKGDGMDHLVTIHVEPEPLGPMSGKKGTGGPGSSGRIITPSEDTAGGTSYRPSQGQAQPAQDSVAPKAGAWEDLQAKVDEDLTVPPRDVPDPATEPGTVRLDEDDLLVDTATRVGEETADQLDNGPGLNSSVGAAKARVGEEKLKSALGVEKVLKETSPLLRTALSDSVETRRAVQQLAETPFYYEKNALGIASDIPVEAKIRQWQSNLAEAVQATERAFIRYRTGTEGARLSTITLGDLVPGNRNGKLTWKAFKEEVGQAMRRNDEHAIPEVAEAAREMRRVLFDPLKERAIQEGLLPEDVNVDTAASYLTRVWNTEKIIAQRPEFVGRVTDWLKGLRDSADARVTEYETGIEELTGTAKKLDDELVLTEGELKLTEQDLKKARAKDVATARDMMAAERDLRQAQREAKRAAERADKFKPTDELSRDDPLAETLKDIRRGVKDKPLDLTAWAVKHGGLKEDGGELAHMGISSKARHGLLNNKSGMNLDDAALKAWEDGYFPMHGERPDIDEFLDALRDDFNGTAKTLTEDGWDAVARQEYLDEFERYLDDLGVDVNKATPAEVRAKMESADTGQPVQYRKATPAAKAKFREIEFHRRRTEGKVANAQDRLQKVTASRDEAILALEKARDDLFKVRFQADDLTKRKNRVKKRLQTLERKREDERYFASADDLELQDIAEEISHKVTGAPAGRIGYEAVPLSRGPLRERTFSIPDTLVEDFLESDVETVARFYTRTMSADVELAGQFGRADMEDAINKVRDDYTRKAMRAETDAERTRLQKAMKADIRDLEGMRDRLRGTYAAPSDPNSLLVRAGRVAREWNYLRLLGGMTASAFPDMGRSVMAHGLTRVWGNGLAPLVKNFRAVQLAGREAKLAGTALDMVLDSRAMSLADVGDDFGRHSKFERGLKSMSDRFGLVSLMAPWNAAMKQWVGAISSTRILEEAANWRAGNIKGANMEHMAMLGIDVHRASRIAAMFDKFGESADGVLIANTDAWTDGEALKTFRAALAKDVDRIIVTPGQDKPLWMSKEWGKLVGQFKSFSMASSHRVLLAGLQQRDMATLNGALIMTFLGMGVTYFKNAEAGREQPKDWKVWVAEGVDRSGITGWFYDVNNIAEKTLGVGMHQALGGPVPSRYASRNIAGALLGPSVGTVQDMAKVGRAVVGTDPWRKSDTRAVRRLLPYQNLVGFRRLVDEAEAGVNDALGAKR